MKKFFMILSGLCMLGSAVVGVANRNELINLGNERTEVRGNVTSVTNELGEAEDKREDAREREVQGRDSRNQAAAAVEGARRELQMTERSLEEVTGELQKRQIEKDEIDLAVRRAFPDGNIRDADDLRMTLSSLEERLNEHQSRKSELNAQLSNASQAKESQVARVREEERYQVERAQQVALGGLTATVIAVNREWGFVMINAGRQHGVQAESSLLVKRGNNRVARLRIVNLEDTVVVADVVDGSRVHGLEVQPGDQVVFDQL